MVGRNLREHPLAQDHDILAPTSSELDLLDQSAVRKFIEKNEPEVVVHAAGRVGGIKANISNPVGFLLENTQIGLNVLSQANDAGVNYCINLASSCMYPRYAPNPLREEQILTGELEPTNEGYALAKIATTRLAQYINQEHGRSYVTLVPCNLYGRYDNFDLHSAHMIPAVVRKVYEAVLNRRSDVTIWGDGEARREFMYAGDLADCVFTVIKEVTDDRRIPDLMNVGIGRDYSINEYYRSIANVIGYSGRFSHDLEKPVGMRKKLVDSSRIEAVGWTTCTSLEEGIAETYKYFLKEVVDG